MSQSIFKGLEVEPGEQSEPYEPAAGLGNHPLMDELFNQLSYWSARRRDHDYLADLQQESDRTDIILFERTVTALHQVLDCEEWLDGKAFLDEFLIQASTRLAVTERCTIPYILDPLVQVFYDLGQNEFDIDFSMLDSFTDYGWFLAGKPDRKLVAVYRADMNNFAGLVHHCHLELYGESAFGCAGATDSVVHFHGKSSEMIAIGLGAERTAFFIESVQAINPEQKECRYHVRQHPELHEVVNLTFSKKFFENNNTLLVPDGNEGWEEITLDTESKRAGF